MGRPELKLVHLRRRRSADLFRLLMSEAGPMPRGSGRASTRSFYGRCARVRRTRTFTRTFGRAVRYALKYIFRTRYSRPEMVSSPAVTVTAIDPVQRD